MNWIMWVGAGVVLLLIVLIMSGRKDRKPSADGHMTTEEMSAAQRDMWERTERAVRQLAADEIRGFVNDALVRHPEGRQH